ncbi:MAG TPA: peptidylprolyl isomerase [Candidatus Bathyarchaeia archaeon]|nr:peptidylprolyl isomerase [Candidatus Bathyarchaeia archaeon]
MNIKNLIILLVVPILIVAAALVFLNRLNPGQKKPEIAVQIEDKSSPTGQEAEEKTNLDMEPVKTLQLPEMEINQNKKYTAVLNTSKGLIKISLFADKTPITANNFVSLARKKFYDGTIFHRVISGFMIQGGDPQGDGTGGPGYQFDDEPFEGEYARGIVAMANAGPNTNGSQFFIMHQNYPLPKNYVIFGQVIEGIEVVDQIAQSPTKLGSSGENSTPIEPTVVNSVSIAED